MKIETTIQIHKSILKRLNTTAEITGKSRTNLVAYLMQRVMNNNHKKLKFFSRVKYQARDIKENWHKLHITLNEYEYEYFLDMRKFFKMSVSYILAYAVRKYLDEIVEKLLDKDTITDNYWYHNYLFIKETVEYDIICWKIYWGIPSSSAF